MSLFERVAREHILKAIDHLETNGLGDFPRSKFYDVMYEGKTYPPKPIMALAEKFSSGKEIETTAFNGGKDTPAFKKLESLGFEIRKKQSIPNLWVEKTLVKGRSDRTEGGRSLGKALWSPRKDKRGADIYKNMREVRKGDIILHLVDNKHFVGTSIAQSDYMKTDGVDGTSWNGPAYLIPLENFQQFENPIPRQDVLNEQNREFLEKISNDSEVFYNSNLDLRQGAYLTPCSQDLYDLIVNPTNEKKPLAQIEFDPFEFVKSAVSAGLLYSDKIFTRFVASLLTKPFLILTGLAGSGKTKLAQSFVDWICQSKDQYELMPVGADWTNREPLLGFPNALDPKDYVFPDSKALQLIIRAIKNPEIPHFLVLDEMNLSHVERYFADFLSVMESDGKINLHSSEECNNPDQDISLPKNLFIIGTVNIDETTYMFSPKVLDRANTIEFRVTTGEMSTFLATSGKVDMSLLKAKGANMAADFVKKSLSRSADEDPKINDALIEFFKVLQKAGAEFGYRTANEIRILIAQLGLINTELTLEEKLDIAIMQKLLPKLHGSRRKLDETLKALCALCVKLTEPKELEQYLSGKEIVSEEVSYPISLNKIQRMYQASLDHGFASYAEA